MHPIKPKGLSLGWVFNLLSIWVGVWVWVFFKSLANFELDNLDTKKILIFGYGFEYKFRKTRKKIKIDTQIQSN
jgi:hypothetical protein